MTTSRPPLELVRPPDERPSDDELMLLCREAGARGERAYAELVVRHEARVRRYLARMVGPAEARDLAQEVFLSLWQRRDRYRPEGRFVVLLYTAARNRALSHLRWRGVRAAFSRQAAPAAPESPRGLEAVLAAEREERLSRALRGLPRPMREALVLHHAEGLDYPTMAAITGVPEGTLRARACRGLALLRRRFADGAHP